MKRFVLALLLIAAVSAAALDCPPRPTQWVTDAAKLLTPTEADLLNAKLRDFEQSSGAQFIVYTLPSVEGDSVEEFSVRCAQSWGVGQKKYDNGLVLFLFKQERKVRVEVGYGLEGTVTDAISSRAIREYMRPYSQHDQNAAALNAGVDYLISVIRKGEAPVPPLQPGGAQREPQPGADISPITIFIILIVVFFVVLPMMRRGGCGGCIFPFFFPGGGITFGGGGGGFGGGFGGGGGFSGGGGSFGGGGATGDW